MKTSGFLHTSMEEYFNKHHSHATCISCLNCIKPKDRSLSFKYNPKMESMNQATYAKGPRYEPKQFVLEQERRNIKKDQPRSPPRTFNTHYTDVHIVKDNLVGSPQKTPSKAGVTVIPKHLVSRNETNMAAIYTSSYAN